jgi:Tfp pilus assembly protein PilO
VPLLRRIVREHRRLLYPLAIALAVNVIAYAVVVYPLSQRVANIEERDRAAEIELAAARGDHNRATGTVTGKDRAAKELETFYTEILPGDVAGARRLTTLRLQQLARQSDLMSETARIEEIEDRDKRLRGLRVGMQLTGTYAAMRTFIYQLETAPEFVIIENVQLSEGTTDEGLLRVNVQVATYYRSAAS